MRIDLDTAFLDDGIRSTNFFNGRLLSAEDLTQEQQARKEALKQLGRAIGEGVVYGLTVEAVTGGGSNTDPTVTVKKGLALNREGRPLELKQEVTVSLLRGAANTESTTGGTGDFGACAPPGSVYVSGTGVYLLVISEADGREGRATTSGLGGLPGTGCEARRLVEGVRFRLLRLDVPEADLQNTSAKVQLLRNKVAYQCFGTPEGALTWPFTEPENGYGLVDKLRPHFLTPCDVPLAVLHWRDGVGIRWVDMWSVRRHPVQVGTPVPWLAGRGERREREAEAMFLQFQEQVALLHVQSLALASVKATDHFAYLPSAGVLPLGGFTGTSGFDYLKFFEGLPARKPITIEGARVAPLLRAARDYPPMELSRKELLWLYLVRENQLAVSAGTASRRPQPYLVFATGHMPYWGDPRFDTAKWDGAHYASLGPSADQPGP
ncbi:hypothetical protein [Myxococcus sp. RHSTA-1-4]|uniref:hypothetical protein n=1 Tax=Myxococcus sp. RHSTA-1-4 TaxID=2874601 RepID=UPI001CBF1889|nr:hypothetical protein [Myxococcus sp. RHSTA-1-4]MBZ4417838.1 hypothetical protein [Myxococcus sp. RHSTA-1-4]